ncbi:hypothetical protein PAECIP111802_04768 [Paenibacillus allorhizosphaerae]|uniref:YtzI protein n=1 Tax=Paenibacillus allorhizosphaerae TaxID=2849866 RepID=A0ABM8VMW9_9BACL|nr:hypothetical protein PAECIP111802_04768 [Paenibacillus allorhizosphaerae]
MVTGIIVVCVIIALVISAMAIYVTNKAYSRKDD